VQRLDPRQTLIAQTPRNQYLGFLDLTFRQVLSYRLKVFLHVLPVDKLQI
jgi:hypothetical protein